ncbi:DoxX family protein [Elioraea rosea]|uniref:DoxX family protein n=1 Tax=Elioraea rosea TaxID=2492390 RepID=UPI00118435BF|nr:DoxX family protein [Elioraea rosea]
MLDRPSNAANAALLLRVSLGVMFLAHGLLLKVMTFGLAGTAGFFQSIGYPAALAYVVIALEIAGGVALILGAYVRVVSLALIPVMIGATLQHLPNGWLFGAQGGGWEFPAFWTVTLVVQALLGPGRWALAEERLPERSTLKTA